MFCGNCGKSVQAGSNFCSDCGGMIPTSGASQPVSAQEPFPSDTAASIRNPNLPSSVFNARTLDENADTQNTSQKPHSISTAVNLLWMYMAITLLRVFTDLSYGLAELEKTGLPPVARLIILIVTLGGTGGLLVFFIFKISAGRNWARIAFLVMFIIGIPIGISQVSAEFARSAFVGALSVAQFGLFGCALFFLFTEPGSGWFYKVAVNGRLRTKGKQITASEYRRKLHQSLQTIIVFGVPAILLLVVAFWFISSSSSLTHRGSPTSSGGTNLNGSSDAGKLSSRAEPSMTEDVRSRVALEKVASEVNRSVPTMIDKDTQLVSVSGLDGILIYNYKLINYTAAQIDHNRFAIGAKQKVAQSACNSPETRDDFLRKGVNLRYSYYDRNNQHIATVDVTPSHCGF